MTIIQLLTMSVAAAAISLSPAALAADNATPEELTSQLRKGGLVIYVRHASTEKDYADQVKADPSNCSTQRTLSEQGWREAELIGSSLSVLNVPVGTVYSSEYCRAWQTAKIAFGSYVKKAELNFEPAEDFTPEQMAAMKERVRPMLSSTPAAGTNTVIVGHDDPFEAATGIYPEPQGVAYVVRPKDGGFDIVGKIAPKDWPEFIATAK